MRRKWIGATITAASAMANSIYRLHTLPRITAVMLARGVEELLAALELAGGVRALAAADPGAAACLSRALMHDSDGPPSWQDGEQLRLAVAVHIGQPERKGIRGISSKRYYSRNWILVPIM